MRHVESTIQIACVKWFRYQHSHLRRLLFAVPNGGYRNPITASIMKAEGAMAGVADLLLLVPNGEYHGLCIEMKAPEGRQADTQKEWQADVEQQGYKYVVCRSVDEFRKEIDKYLNT